MPSTISGNLAGHLERWLQVRADEVIFANYLFDTAERFLRLIQGNDLNNCVMMTICISILQDYDEVLAMWTMNLGDGANKLARPLYEKALTFAYLAGHPNEIKDFVDYSSVHWHKILDEGASPARMAKTGFPKTIGNKLRKTLLR